MPGSYQHSIKATSSCYFLISPIIFESTVMSQGPSLDKNVTQTKSVSVSFSWREPMKLVNHTVSARKHLDVQCRPRNITALTRLNLTLILFYSIFKIKTGLHLRKYPRIPPSLPEMYFIKSLTCLYFEKLKAMDCLKAEYASLVDFERILFPFARHSTWHTAGAHMFAELNPRATEGREKLPRDRNNKRRQCQKVQPELCRTNSKTTNSMSHGSRQRRLMITVVVTD